MNRVGVDWSESKRLHALAIAAIAVGVFLRLRQYFFARSLWLDEASVSLRLIEAPLRTLLQPELGNNQMAPSGFLVLEKLTIGLLGTSEMALRFIPMIGGLLALGMLYPVAKRYVGERAAVIVIWLGAMNNHLIYYSNEVKQYSTDVTVALALLWLAYRAGRTDARWTDWLGLGIAGAIAVWLSYPAAFVVATSGIVLFAANLYRKDRSGVVASGITGGAWLISFGILFVLFVGEQSQNVYMRESWTPTFAPFPPTGLQDLRWYLNAAVGFFRHPMGLVEPGLLAAVFAFGLLRWIRTPARQYLLGLALGPLVITIGVSALQLYPFNGRLLLFLVPGMLFIVARGLFEIANESQTLGRFLTFLVIAPPAIGAMMGAINPTERQNLRLVLNRINYEMEEGDHFIVTYNAERQFNYYQLREVIDAEDYEVFGRFGGVARSTFQRESLDRLAEQMAADGRYWVIISHRSGFEARIERNLLFAELARLGTEGRRIRLRDMTAVLITVGDPPEVPEPPDG